MAFEAKGVVKLSSMRSDFGLYIKHLHGGIEVYGGARWVMCGDFGLYTEHAVGH